MSLLWVQFTLSPFPQHDGLIFLTRLAQLHLEEEGTGTERRTDFEARKKICPQTDHFCVIHCPLTSPSPVASSMGWAPFCLLSPFCREDAVSLGSVNMCLCY